LKITVKQANKYMLFMAFFLSYISAVCTQPFVRLFWLGPDILFKNAGIKLVLCTQTPLGDMMWS
jgi:hypothetical protein